MKGARPPDGARGGAPQGGGERECESGRNGLAPPGAKREGIGYNTARTPGLGSAIFLHINVGMPTAGCVTLPVGELPEILRWLNPAASPRIAVGVLKRGA